MASRLVLDDTASKSLQKLSDMRVLIPWTGRNNGKRPVTELFVWPGTDVKKPASTDL